MDTKQWERFGELFTEDMKFYIESGSVEEVPGRASGTTTSGTCGDPTGAGESGRCDSLDYESTVWSHAFRSRTWASIPTREPRHVPTSGGSSG